MNQRFSLSIISYQIIISKQNESSHAKPKNTSIVIFRSVILRVKFPVDYIKLPSSLVDGAFFLLMSLSVMNLPSTFKCFLPSGPWPSTAVFATGTGGGGAGGVARGKGGGGGAGLETLRLRQKGLRDSWKLYPAIVDLLFVTFLKWQREKSEIPWNT